MFDYIKKAKYALETKENNLIEIKNLGEKKTDLIKYLNKLDNEINKKISQLNKVNEEISIKKNKLYTLNNEQIIKTKKIYTLSNEIDFITQFLEEIRCNKDKMLDDIINLNEEIALFDNEIIERKALLKNLLGVEIDSNRNSFYKYRYYNFEKQEADLIDLCNKFVARYDCSALLHLTEEKSNHSNLRKNHYDISSKLDKNQISIFMKLLINKGYDVDQNKDKYVNFLKYSVLEKNYMELKAHFHLINELSINSTLKDVIFAYYDSLHTKELTLIKNLAFLSYYLEINKYIVHYNSLDELYSEYVEKYHEEYKILKLEELLKKPIEATSFSVEDVELMSGNEFEHFLSDMFKRHNYKTEVTKSTGDQGADLIIEKNNVRYAVQAKRYSGVVGNKAVQEALSGMHYYKTNLAMVVTTNEFTKAAKELASVSNVILIDRHELYKLINMVY